MPTWLYALLPPGSSAPPPALAGVGSARVRALRTRVADAWVSDAPGEGSARDVTAARAHDAVVQSALDTGVTPVPARFGQRFPSDQACVAALEREAARLEALLERVHGMVEMSVIARLGPGGPGGYGGPPPIATCDSEPQNAPPASRAAVPTGATHGAGRAYLMARKAELALEQNLQRSASALRARVTAALQPLKREEAVRYAPPPAATLTLSHLIARDAVDRYRSALAGLREGPGSPPLAIVGPTAPYRFAELPDAGT